MRWHPSLIAVLFAGIANCKVLLRRDSEKSQRSHRLRVKLSSAPPGSFSSNVSQAAFVKSNASRQMKAAGLSPLSAAAAKTSSKSAAAAPIEEFLMGMTPDQVQHMASEMMTAGSNINNAIQFVRSHPNEGWTWCANQGAVCSCVGWARYGTHGGGWPSFSDAIQSTGTVFCNAATFQSSIAQNLAGLQCQCSPESERQSHWQNAALHYNSVSYLQEVWIMLTRVLGQGGLLPTNGDRTWNGEGLFSARGGGSHDRTFMNIFLEEAKAYLPQTPSTCIEWAPKWYMPQFPACASGTQLNIEYTPDVNSMRVDPATGNVYSDNVHLPQVIGQNRVDIAINTNVWEHEQDPHEAMIALYHTMKPGGVMLFTVPFVAPFHGVPYDFYRYTKSGVVHTLEKAGFCVPKSRMASGGDFIYDIALMGGVAPGDFSKEEMWQAYRRGYDNIPDGALVVMAVAHRKGNPTDICPP